MTQSQTFNYLINDGFFWSEVNLKGEKHYYIEGFASTIDKDKAGEVIDYTAQQDIYNQIQNENITLDIEHEQWYSEEDGKLLPRPRNDKIPVAKIIHAELRPEGVWVKAEINRNLKSFSEVWGSIKEKFLKAFSVAFYPTQKMGNIIKSLNLVNITLTGSPVNPNATFTASMKSAAAWLASQESQSIITSPTSVVEDSYGDNIKQTNGGAEKMADQEEIKVDVKAEPQKEEVSAPVAEVKSEVSELQKMKEEYDAQLKALKEELTATVTAQKDEIASLKAELAKPVMKATVEKEPVKAELNNINISPLKVVR